MTAAPQTQKPEPTCFECGTAVADEPGRCYCDACVKEQLREQGGELRDFDLFHAWADRVGRP